MSFVLRFPDHQIFKSEESLSMTSLVERKNIPVSKSILHEQEYRIVQSIRKRRARSYCHIIRIKAVRGRTVSNIQRIRLEEVFSQ